MTSNGILCVSFHPRQATNRGLQQDFKKSAYGMNGAPRRWWNKVDTALRNYGMTPTRADRCTYVLFSEPIVWPGTTTFAKGVSKNTPTDKHLVPYFEAALEYLLDRVTGSAANNRKVLGVLCLHVDDPLFAG